MRTPITSKRAAMAAAWMLAALTFAGPSARAQDLLDGSGFGSATASKTLRYRDCNGLTSTAEYVSGPNGTTWRVTDANGQVRESTTLSYIGPGQLCATATLDVTTAAGNGGTYFRIHGGVTTQTLKVLRLDSFTETMGVQLDRSGRQFLVRQPPAGTVPQGKRFAETLYYLGCDGSLLMMSFPHMATGYRGPLIRAAHTTGISTQIKYLDPAGTCKTFTLVPGTMLKFHSYGGGPHFSWTLPYVYGDIDARYQGFILADLR